MIFISWQPYCTRSDSIAHELGGKSYNIYFGIFGSNYYTILFKYFFQGLKTLEILLKNRPETVFVMSPPLFACIPVYFYCLIFKKNFLIDAHTGAFTNQLWQPVMFLQRFFSKKALCTIITNSGLIKYLEKWGAKFIVISDVPIIPPKTKIPSFFKNKGITLVNTFANDEPLEEFLLATKKLPDFNFYITGKIPKTHQHLANDVDSNVLFTGFLELSEYFGLLIASKLIVVLTTLDNTMQRGAYEAIYNNKPIVTSNWKVLRENFNGAAVFVDNNAHSIKQGICLAIQNLDQLKHNATILKSQKLQRWEENKYILCSILHLNL